MVDCFTPCCTCLCFPFVCCASWQTVQPNEHLVVTSWGRYTNTVTEPGVRWVNCLGADITRVSVCTKSITLPASKMLDSMANPLLAGAIVVYKICDSRKATFDVKDSPGFVSNMASTVLKQVVCKYPYQAPNIDSKYPCLQQGNNCELIIHELIAGLQRAVDKAGIQVLDFKFDTLSYAPEIASSMLKRQQAFALVQAKTTLVNGAVSIAQGAIEKMEKSGVVLSNEGKERMLTSLLTVIVSDSDAAPTIQL